MTITDTPTPADASAATSPAAGTHPVPPLTGPVQWVWAHAPLLGMTGLLAVAVVSAGAGLARWARRARRRAARRAVWLAISPPATLAPTAPLALWQALAGLLRRANRPGRWPRVALAVEFVATHDNVRAGVWVPPAIPARTVARAITGAWPGARVTPQGRGPSWLRTPHTGAGAGAGCVIAVAELAPLDRWAPLTDPTPLPRAGTRPGGEAGEERLRAVLAALAERAPGEAACTQLVITTGTTWHNTLRNPREWCLRAATVLLNATMALLDEVLHIIGPPPTRHTTRPGTAAPRPATTATTAAARLDPAVAAAVKAREAKRACGPHLHATLRVAVHRHPTNPTRPTEPARRRRRRHRRRVAALAGRVAEIAAGYDLMTPTLRARSLHRPEPVAIRQPGTGFAATLPELAALWHLPGEPTAHHMAAPRARTHRPTHNINQIPHPPRTPLRRTTGGGRRPGRPQ